MPIIPNPYDSSFVGSPAWKIPVEAAETAGNINVANPGTNIIGGVDMDAALNKYVALTNQTNTAENGIYLYDSSSTALTRAVWANTSDKIDNAVVIVDNGLNERKLYSFDIDGSRIFETDPIVVTELTSSMTADERVKVTPNDTTADYLLSKLVVGRGTSATELNDGANETLEIEDAYADFTFEPTGFDDSSAITVTYDSGTRKVTLAGTFKLYYRGNLILDISASSWESPAHAAGPDSPLFLYYNGAFVWTNTPWEFFDAQIAYVFYDDLSNFYFGLREVHGFMPWQTHLHLHNTVGTFRRSGGTFSNFVLGSTTPGDRRPDISTTTVVDEDIETINAALTSNLYTQFYLSGATPDFNFDVDEAEIVPVSPTLPFWNEDNGGTWQQTLLADGEFMCVWLVASPTTADTQSQKYRYFFVQGQSAGILADQLNLTPGSLNIDDIGAAFPEYVFIAKIILERSGSDWSINDIQQISSSSSNLVSGATNTDELAKVSANDNVSDYLINKVVSGAGISVTELNDGATETIEIANTGVITDELAKVTSNDTTSNYLLSKIVAGTGIQVNELNDGGNETLEIVNTVADTDTDELAKVSANDTTAGYLNGKLTAGANISLTEQNDGGNENLEIAVTGIAGGDVTAALNITDDRVVRGDGGVKGVQDSGVTLDDNNDMSGGRDLSITRNLDVPTGTIRVGHNFQSLADTYELSVQSNTAFTYIEILNNGGIDKGAFICLENNGAPLTDQDFALYNWQGGPIVFYTDTSQSSGQERFEIENDGTLNVSGQTNYETKVTDDDDIPNKKYVDDNDDKVRISANDTTNDFLVTKVVAGTNISVTELNDGANETLEIAVTGVVGTDELLKVSANDTTANYLLPKLVAGNNIDITEQNDGSNETILIDVETLTKSDISDFVEGDYVHTTGNENVGGVKTFTTEVPIVIDSPSTAADLEIGYFTGTSIDCYGVRRSDTSGVFCFMPNSDNPQIFLGNESNTTGEGFIDVDNNRPLNLNVLDTGAGTPAIVNIGSGGLNINSGGDLNVAGGNITMAASNTVDGVDVGSPKNSIEVDSNQYQLVGDAPAPGNNKVYATDGTGTKGWYDVSTTAGVSLQGIWKYDDPTGASDPGSGQFRINNSDPALATALYISDETETGFDFSVILGALGIGDVLYFQNEEDASEGILATISSITDNGSWYNFGITVNDNNGSSFTDGKEFGFVFVIGVGTPTDSNLVTALANITDNRIVRGDGGAKGIQESLWTIADDGTLSASFGKPNGQFMVDIQNTTASGDYIQMQDFNGNASVQFRQATDGGGIVETLLPSGNIYFQAEDAVVKIGDTPNIVNPAYDLLIDHGVLGISNTSDDIIGIQAPASGFTDYTLTLPTDDGEANEVLTTDGAGVLSWSPVRKIFQYTADNVLSPTGSDWAVNDFASLGSDTNNSSLRVRRFDNATEEGIGFVHDIPVGVTNVTFKFKTRAETTPGAGETSIMKIYRRNISDDTAVPAWSAAQTLTAFSYPANENWQFDEQTFSLASLGLTAGDIAEYEITRDGGTMAIDMTLLLLVVEYT